MIVPSGSHSQRAKGRRRLRRPNLHVANCAATVRLYGVVRACPMPQVQQPSPPPLVRSPVCPDFLRPMRIGITMPDDTHYKLRHTLLSVIVVAVATKALPSPKVTSVAASAAHLVQRLDCSQGRAFPAPHTCMPGQRYAKADRGVAHTPSGHHRSARSTPSWQWICRPFNCLQL
jgi:hypothetical protein